MKFLSVRNGGNEFALAGAVKEIVTRWRSSLPKKKNGWALPDELKRSSLPVDKRSSMGYYKIRKVKL